MDMGQNISSILEQMANFFQSDTVVGDPIQVGEITIIPLITVSFGLGNGASFSSNEKKGHWSPSGAVSGGKISPSAIIVIKNNEVSAISLAGKGTLDKLNELMPVIMGHLGKKDAEMESSSS